MKTNLKFFLGKLILVFGLLMMVRECESAMISEPPPAVQSVIVEGNRERVVTMVAWSSDLTLLKAILRAGGISGSQFRAAQIERAGRLIAVDLKKIIDGHEVDQKLEPGDRITVVRQQLFL